MCYRFINYFNGTNVKAVNIYSKKFSLNHMLQLASLHQPNLLSHFPQTPEFSHLRLSFLLSGIACALHLNTFSTDATWWVLSDQVGNGHFSIPPSGTVPQPVDEHRSPRSMLFFHGQHAICLISIFGTCGDSSAKRAPAWAFKPSVRGNRLEGMFILHQQQGTQVFQIQTVYFYSSF